MLKSGMNFIREGENVIRIVPSGPMQSALSAVRNMGNEGYKEVVDAYWHVQRIAMSGIGDLNAAVERFQKANAEFYKGQSNANNRSI